MGSHVLYTHDMSCGRVEQLAEADDEALTDRFRELEVQRRAIEAEMARIVSAGERRVLHAVDGHRSMKQWIIAQTNCPSSDAARLRRLAKVIDVVPTLGDALGDGHIGTAQANEFARAASNPRVGGEIDSVVPILLQHAEHLGFDDFRVVVRRWETLADLDGVERNDEASHDRRTASVLDVDGSVMMRASGGTGMVTAELMGIFQRFVEAEFAKDVAARTAEFGPDAPASKLPRTDAQRRYDAMVEIFRAAVLAPADGVAPTPVVNVLVGFHTFQRLLARRGMGVAPGPPEASELMVERMESSTGVTLAPTTSSPHASRVSSGALSSIRPASWSTQAASADCSPASPESSPCCCGSAAGTSGAPCRPISARSTTWTSGTPTTVPPTRSTLGHGAARTTRSSRNAASDRCEIRTATSWTTDPTAHPCCRSVGDRPTIPPSTAR
jgi:hypothetical protein